MGHGWRNYLMVAFKDLHGIGRVSGLDKRLPILGTVDQAADVLAERQLPRSHQQ